MFHSLSIDLSSTLGSVAVHRHQGEGIELLSTRKLTEKFKHSEKLVGAIEEALRESRLEIKDIQDFVTSSGPGSFTGLRVAMSTLKAFSMALGKPILAVSSTEVRALDFLARNPSITNFSLFTKISSGRFLETRFEYSDSLKTLSEETVTAGEDTECTAALVGEYYRFCASRVSASTIPEVAALSPTYYGTRFQ